MYTLYTRGEKGEKLFFGFFGKLIRVYSKVIALSRSQVEIGRKKRNTIKKFDNSVIVFNSAIL